MSRLEFPEFKPTFNVRLAEQKKYLAQLENARRVNQASDDATSLAIATRINADVVALGAAATTAATGQALLAVADGGLAATSGILEQLKSLATLAQSGALSAADLATANDQFTALTNELDAIASTTSFNGQSLLDGSSGFATGATFQLGANAGDTVTVTLNSTTSAALGLSTSNLLTPANAASALNAIDAAIAAVAGDRAQVGATASQFEFSSALIAATRENSIASVSSLLDADVADAKSKETVAALLNEANITALERTNAKRKNLLSLLQ